MNLLKPIKVGKITLKKQSANPDCTEDKKPNYVSPNDNRV